MPFNNCSKIAGLYPRSSNSLLYPYFFATLAKFTNHLMCASYIYMNIYWILLLKIFMLVGKWHENISRIILIVLTLVQLQIE